MSSHIEYWVALHQFARDLAPELDLGSPSGKYDLNVNLGRPGARLAFTRLKSGSITCELYLTGEDAREAFHALRAERDAIEADIGRLDWLEREGVVARRVLQARDAAHDDVRDWPAQHAWFIDRARRFRMAFLPRLLERRPAP